MPSPNRIPAVAQNAERAKVANAFCDSLFEIIRSERRILFAGAGVSVHAGLRDWRGFVAHLITVAEKYEKETAAIMAARTKAGLLADAVSYYKLCRLIPEGIKFKELAAPFEDNKCDATTLHQLVKLPFEAIVTTNYDRNLDHAWAAVNKRAPQTFELDDGSLKQAAFSSEYYIARIHGRTQKPQYMVASTEDFAKLDENSSYKDFLLQTILTRRNCLFLGDSFLDPAINKILEMLEKQIGPNYPRLHYAVLPTGSDAESLAARLAAFNIQVLSYPDHKTLWNCIESLPLRLVGVRKAGAPPKEFPLPYEQMRVFLASCYVQSKMSHAAAPLRDLVVRGIILTLLEQEKGPKAVPQLSRLLRQMIPLDKNEAELATVRAVDALVEKGLLSSTDGEIKIEKLPPKDLENNIDSLVKGALNRLLVREGVEAKTIYPEAIRSVLQEVFLTRGWDLGAEFAGTQTVSRVDLYETIQTFLVKALPAEPFDTQSHVANAIYDLLRRPDEAEAQILSDVARLSFGLNVILRVGNSALRLEALPERIYFDASILLPAITDGHPFRPVYQSTIDKISKAVAETGKTCELLVISDFLNEIVSHRQRAIKMVKELGLEDPGRLEKHILYYGAENTNVFVGSYASWVGRQKDTVPFDAFLAETAPYSSEASLATFIERFGIRTVRVALGDPGHKKTYQDFLGSLGGAYREFGVIGWSREKPDVLVQHEALQLAQTELELKVGRATLFVTADKALRQIVNMIRLGTVWNVVISHLGLVQLTDLLLGVDAEPRSLARVLWGTMEINEHVALRDYFINLALKKYDEALAMTLPQIIGEFVSDAEQAAKQEGIKFFTKRVEDTAKAARFLDRFEAQFFERMAEAIRRRRAQDKHH